MNQIAYFEIQASDCALIKDFYQSIFAWTFSKVDGIPIEYYTIETEGIRGGLLKRPAQTPGAGFGTNAFTCSMQVADFDACQKDIIEHGGQIALEKFAIPGRCYQGYFIDPDGNTFGIFEVDENAA
ncbi:VOC family protein [Marinilongibacter aquaticus]|uniref:VOC family protein n=1 Tax=Marinilongibacter aquaticus TaxID=2975157 RepID=UPI0021BD14E2|nr:VOC family protein [Marinilongibacter aquaticus]UBM59080.1 VOC family protein [Marinilongibacter aquaticus]